MYTILETAKANKVNVCHYLRYPLEQIPKHLDNKSFDFLDDMILWSDKYFPYEKTQAMYIPKLLLKEMIMTSDPKRHVEAMVEI